MILPTLYIYDLRIRYEYECQQIYIIVFVQLVKFDTLFYENCYLKESSFVHNLFGYIVVVA